MRFDILELNEYYYYYLLLEYLASRYLNALLLAHRGPIWLSKTPITHIFQSLFSQWQPFKPSLNVEIYYIEGYTK